MRTSMRQPLRCRRRTLRWCHLHTRASATASSVTTPNVVPKMNAADIQELVRVLKPIGNQSDHSACDLHYPQLCPLTQVLGHDVKSVSFKNCFVF